MAQTPSAFGLMGQSSDMCVFFGRRGWLVTVLDSSGRLVQRRIFKCQSERGCSALFTNELQESSLYMLGLPIIELDRWNYHILGFLPLFQVTCVSCSFSVSFCADTLRDAQSFWT